MGSALDDEWGDTATAAFEATVINSEAAGADRSTLTCPCNTGEYTGIISNVFSYSEPAKDIL